MHCALSKTGIESKVIHPKYYKEWAIFWHKKLSLALANFDFMAKIDNFLTFMLIHFLNADYNFVLIIVYESMKKNHTHKKDTIFFWFFTALGIYNFDFQQLEWRDWLFTIRFDSRCPKGTLIIGYTISQSEMQVNK